TVAIERAANQLAREMAFPVLHGLDPDFIRILRAQFQRQLPDVAMWIVPRLAPTEESENQDLVLLHGRRSGEVIVALSARENAACERQQSGAQGDQTESPAEADHPCHTDYLLVKVPRFMNRPSPALPLNSLFSTSTGPCGSPALGTALPRASS